MSIPFESSVRQRAVDVSIDDSDDLLIDGTRLKQERIERGITVNDAARMATLSREQIEQIESGGLRAFYGARHKRLAARKYADVFGIELADLMLAPPQAAEIQSEQGETVQPRTFATVPAPVVESSRGVLAQSSRPNFESRRLPLLMVILVVLVLTFSILRGLTPTPRASSESIAEPVAASMSLEASPASAPAAATTPAAAEPAVAAMIEAPAAQQVAANELSNTTAAEDAAAIASKNATLEDGSDPCAFAATVEVARWAPEQVRTTYTKLYLGSYTESTLCVVDAAGMTKPLKLKAGGTTSLSGKPPYTIHSQQLPKLQIYLQGLKVKVPPGAVSIQLFTTQSLLPKEPNPPAPEDSQ